MGHQQGPLTHAGVGLVLFLLMAVLLGGCDPSSGGSEEASGTSIRLAFTTRQALGTTTRQESPGSNVRTLTMSTPWAGAVVSL